MLPDDLKEHIVDKGIIILSAKKIADADEDGDGEKWLVEEQKIKYAVVQDYEDNGGNPILKESFNTEEEAVQELEKLEAPDEWQNGGSEHYAFIDKDIFQRETVYEKFMGAWDDDDEKWELKDGMRTNHDKSFGTREDDAEDLEHKAYFNLRDDISGEYETDGVVVKIRGTGSGKYGSVWIEDLTGDDIGSIELRISDHSYNPRNNSSVGDGFISVVIANKDETKDRFRGMYNLYFDGDNSYEDIVDEVKERIQEILDGVDIQERIKKQTYAHGGQTSKPKVMSKLDQLKDQIKQQLDLCDSTETPTICAIKDTAHGYADIEKMVIEKVLYGPDPSIANAIVEIENTYNINSADQ